MTGTGRNTLVNIMLLLRAVRWYNVGLILFSQYLIAFFVFHTGQQLLHVLSDVKLHLIVFSSSLALAGAFLINGFYDIEKDLVNHPKRVALYRMLGQNFLLNVYASTVVLCILLSLAASVKVFIFIVGLVFMFWFYSHKLQKLPLIREITATLLAIAPFIAIWLHYGSMHFGMFLYVGSLAIVGFTREVVKDLTGNKGNIIFGYQTVVVAAGQQFTKRWLVYVNMLLTIGFAIGFFAFVNVWDYYSIISGFSILCSLLIAFACVFSREQGAYQIADTMLKSIIVIHLVSVVFAAGVNW